MKGRSQILYKWFVAFDFKWIIRIDISMIINQVVQVRKKWKKLNHIL
jgi:hypothetical protein